jgi:hypothetical protein
MAEQVNLRYKENEMSEKISSFKDLRVYNLAFELQQEIFKPRSDFQRKSATL